MGLNVDIVRQGSGTSNDDNTARKFFENPKKTAKITGLNESNQEICSNTTSNNFW